MNPIQANPETTGVKCPRCSDLIKTSIQELIISSSIRCPKCSLQLVIDKFKSKEALSALHRVQEAQNRVNAKSKF